MILKFLYKGLYITFCIIQYVEKGRNIRLDVFYKMNVLKKFKNS